MKPEEVQRGNEQRRIADIVDQYETVKIDSQLKLMGIIIAACTFFGSIIAYMSVNAAKDVVSPYEGRVSRVEARVEANEKRFDRIESKMDRTLDLLEQMNRK